MKNVIPFLILAAVAQIYANDCTTLTQDECHRNSSCTPINYKSCCGEQQFGCAEGDIGTCKYVNSCYKSSKSLDIIEASNECFIPPVGYEAFIPLYACSDDKIQECSKKGKQCIFKRNTCPNPTSCCPGTEICEGDVGPQQATTTGIASTSTTTGGAGSTTAGRGGRMFNFCENVYCPIETHCEYSLTEGKTNCIPDVCTNIECPPNFHCEKNNESGNAHCVANISPSGGGSTIGLISTFGGLTSTTTGGSSTTGGPILDVCSNVQCPPNFHCEKNNENGNAHCVANISPSGGGSTTGLVSTFGGLTSTSGGSSTTGGPILDVCSNVQCPPNHHCEKNNQNGFAQCVVNISPSGGGSTTTGPIFDFCTVTICPANTHCEINQQSGFAQCALDIKPL